MSYRTKLLFLTLIPILLITLATLWLLETQSRRLAAAQHETIEAVIVEEKKEELRNYLSLAEKAIEPTYNSFLKTKRQAQAEAKAILREMSANEDQYFFVYDSTGNVIVEPRLSFMQGKNWIGLTNKDGIPVIKNLIEAAKGGQEFYSFIWQKPSTKQYVPKLNHAKYFERWDWILGTGIYLDDVDDQIDTIDAQLVESFSQTKRGIAILASAALAATAFVMWIFQFSQQRLADAQLRQLNKRLVDVQETNRKRISQELHDGISQLLVSARYSLEAALGEIKSKSAVSKTVKASMDSMDGAISEVRRISLFLRPTVLDDVGLAAALRGLGKDFERDTRTPTTTTTMPVGNLLTDEAKTALYRIVQEALTNITKYANAQNVTIDLQTSRRRVTLVVSDDGTGFDPKKLTKGAGLGLRNMRERIDSFGGQIKIGTKINGGTRIWVALPIHKSGSNKV
jgi:two-component system NarL family sensor kinase